MNTWGIRTFGDPCAECRFRWDTDLDTARGLVAEAPVLLAELLRGATGTERHPQLSWSTTAYVAHMSDNLRIFAERIAGVALGGPRSVSAYDEDVLAAVRHYDAISLAAAVWSFEQSVATWLTALDLAPADLTFDHSERGAIDLTDVVQGNAHDVAHHLWDIERSLRH